MCSSVKFDLVETMCSPVKFDSGGDHVFISEV